MVRHLDPRSASFLLQQQRRRWQPCVTLSRACAAGRLTLCRVWAGHCTQPAAVQQDTEHTGQDRTCPWDQRVSRVVLDTSNATVPLETNTDHYSGFCCWLKGLWLWYVRIFSFQCSGSLKTSVTQDFHSHLLNLCSFALSKVFSSFFFCSLLFLILFLILRVVA